MNEANEAVNEADEAVNEADEAVNEAVNIVSSGSSPRSAPGGNPIGPIWRGNGRFRGPQLSATSPASRRAALLSSSVHRKQASIGSRNKRNDTRL